MSASLSRPHVAATLVLAALAAGMERRAEAQIGIGMGFGGDPFAVFVPQMVPSPTDYLHQVSLERMAANNQGHQQRAAMVAHTNENAYWNRLRDNSGANTYDLASRRNLRQRVGSTARPNPTASRPSPAAAQPTALAQNQATAPPRPKVHSLEDFYRDGAQFDWPRDAPDNSDRAAADQALRAVFDQVRAGGRATAQSVAAARARLVTYVQDALPRVKSERSRAVSNVFRYFLVFLEDTLLELGGDGSQ